MRLAMPGPITPAFGRALVQGLATAGRQVVGLVYPPTCIACGAATGEPHPLGGRGGSGVRFMGGPFCDGPGPLSAADLGTPLIPPAAMADPPVFARARAVARYDDTARQVVHRLKYS